MTNSWDIRYSEPGFAYGTEPNDFLAASLKHLKPGGTVLCLAEGEGRNSVFLAQHGYQVTAVDYSAVGLEKARNLAAAKEVEIKTQLVDLDDYPINSESYDGIVSIFCHLPRSIRQKIHSQINPSLKTGGSFIMEAYTPKQLLYGTGGPPQEELLMELDQVREELNPLKIVYAKEVTREIHEGTYHNGVGAVVQLIGMKS